MKQGTYVVKTEVRQVIYDIDSSKIPVTLKIILEEGMINKQIWEVKRTSLWNLENRWDCGKTYSRKALCEQGYVVILRRIAA